MRPIARCIAVCLAALLASAACLCEESKKEEVLRDGLGSMLGFVCLKEKTFPSEKALDAAFKKWFNLPDDAPLKVEADRGKGTVTLTAGKRSAVIGLIARPVPKDEIKYACSNAHFWPDAWKELEGHQAHLIVIPVGNLRDFKERHGRSLFISRVAAACTEAFPAAGVYWGDAATVHSPDPFRKAVLRAVKKPEDLPVVLWVGFLRDDHEDGTVSFYTKGLVEFGCMELEVSRSKRKPLEIVALLHGLSQYLIDRGNVIKDGDTVGPDRDTKIKTRHVDSLIRPRQKVIRVDY